jgi:hypothetical protein
MISGKKQGLKKEYQTMQTQSISGQDLGLGLGLGVGVVLV